MAARRSHLILFCSNLGVGAGTDVAQVVRMAIGCSWVVAGIIIGIEINKVHAANARSGLSVLPYALDVERRRRAFCASTCNTGIMMFIQ